MKDIQNLSDAELVQRLHRAMTDLPDAPPAVQQAAIDLWPVPGRSALPSIPPLVRAVARRVAAALTFDSWATPAFGHGMRSAGAAPRHLVFSALGRDVDLRIALETGRFALVGQLLGPDEPGVVELAPHGLPGGVTHRVPLDACGEFRVDGLPAGSFALTLSVGDDQIVLPAIELGQRSG